MDLTTGRLLDLVYQESPLGEGGELECMLHLEGMYARDCKPREATREKGTDPQESSPWTRWFLASWTVRNLCDPKTPYLGNFVTVALRNRYTAHAWICFCWSQHPTCSSPSWLHFQPHVPWVSVHMFEIHCAKPYVIKNLKLTTAKTQNTNYLRWNAKFLLSVMWQCSTKAFYKSIIQLVVSSKLD